MEIKLCRQYLFTLRYYVTNVYEYKWTENVFYVIGIGLHVYIVIAFYITGFYGYKQISNS